MALIDLGVVQPHATDSGDLPAPRRRRRSPRTALGGLTLGLLVLLTGAAHHPPPPRPTFIDAALGDRMWVTDDRLFVAGGGTPLLGTEVKNAVISEYVLPRGDLLSRTTVAVTGPIFDVRSAGKVILVSYQLQAEREEATVALAAGTDRALWRQPSRMLAVSGPDNTVLLRDNTPEYGNVNWYGIDLSTGAIRWKLRQPMGGVTTAASDVNGFPRLIVTATGRGDLEVRDAVSGTVTATAKVALRPLQAGADLPVWSAADLLLVGSPEGTIGYTLPNLVRRWQTGINLAGRWVQPDCVAAVCSLRWGGGMLVLDPATGQRRWADDRWSYAEQVGSYLLASNTLGPAGTAVSAVVDPRDGEVHGDFGTWRAVGAGRADGTMVGLREMPVESTVWYALLDPDTLRVRVLGMADLVAGDCRPTPDVLVCRRLDSSIGLWPLK